MVGSVNFNIFGSHSMRAVSLSKYKAVGHSFKEILKLRGRNQHWQELANWFSTYVSRLIWIISCFWSLTRGTLHRLIHKSSGKLVRKSFFFQEFSKRFTVLNYNLYERNLANCLVQKSHIWEVLAISWKERKYLEKTWKILLSKAVIMQDPAKQLLRKFRKVYFPALPVWIGEFCFLRHNFFSDETEIHPL